MQLLCKFQHGYKATIVAIGPVNVLLPDNTK